MVDAIATWVLAMLARVGVDAIGAGTEPLPIVGGDDVEACAFPSIVALLEDDETPLLCTGSLVHPEIVLTAGHCLIEERPIVGVGFGEVAQGEPGLARTIEVVECVGAGELGDIAYCVLAEPVDDVPIVPLSVGCDADALVEGGEVTLVGYGATYAGVDEMGALVYEGSGVKRSVLQTLDSVGPGFVSMVGSNGSESACFGDSGGPALVELSDGTWRVFAVTSAVYDPGGFPAPIQPGNVCGVGVESTHMTGHVAALESMTGRDLTPCHDDDGAWDPTPDCAAIPTSPQLGAGEWATGCADGPVGGGAPLCGEITGTDDGTESGSTDDSGTNGGAEASGTETSEGGGAETTTLPDPTTGATTSSDTSVESDGLGTGDDDGAQTDDPSIGDRGCACVTTPPDRGALAWLPMHAWLIARRRRTLRRSSLPRA